MSVISFSGLKGKVANILYCVLSVSDTLTGISSLVYSILLLDDGNLKLLTGTAILVSQKIIIDFQKYFTDFYNYVYFLSWQIFIYLKQFFRIIYYGKRILLTNFLYSNFGHFLWLL